MRGERRGEGVGGPLDWGRGGGVGRYRGSGDPGGEGSLGRGAGGGDPHRRGGSSVVPGMIAVSSSPFPGSMLVVASWRVRWGRRRE